MDGVQRKKFLDYYNANCLNKSKCEIPLNVVNGWPISNECAQKMTDREFFSKTLTGGDKLKINGLESTNCKGKCVKNQFCSLDNTFQEFCDSCEKFATPTDCKEGGLP
jgi:hypothetical protein